jgi:hypothetical protein
LDGISRFNRVSKGADRERSRRRLVGLVKTGCIPGAIWQTGLTSGDTILTWTTVVMHLRRRDGSCGTRLGVMAAASAVRRSPKPLMQVQGDGSFADVEHEGLARRWVRSDRRAIMTELVSRSAAVVQRYGGTVDQFTGERVVALPRPMRGRT